MTYRITRSLALAATLALPLLGCTTWAKPGATPAMRDAALANCRAIGYGRVPTPMMTTMTSPGGYIPGKKSCTTGSDGKTRCTKTEGSYQGPTFSTQDANEDARDAVIDDCMYRQGWQKVNAM